MSFLFSELGPGFAEARADFSGYPRPGRFRVNDIPEGKYLMEILESRLTDGCAGEKRVAISFRILEGTFSGIVLLDIFTPFSADQRIAAMENVRLRCLQAAIGLFHAEPVDSTVLTHRRFVGYLTRKNGHTLTIERFYTRNGTIPCLGMPFLPYPVARTVQLGPDEAQAAESAPDTASDEAPADTPDQTPAVPFSFPGMHASGGTDDVTGEWPTSIYGRVPATAPDERNASACTSRPAHREPLVRVISRGEPVRVGSRRTPADEYRRIPRRDSMGIMRPRPGENRGPVTATGKTRAATRNAR